MARNKDNNNQGAVVNAVAPAAEEEKTGAPPQTPPGEGARAPYPGPTPAGASPLDPEEGADGAADNSPGGSNSRRRGADEADGEREERKKEEGEREERKAEEGKKEEGKREEKGAGRESSSLRHSRESGNLPASVSEWILEKRLAGWQSAALLRAEGWTADKRVTAAEFDKALRTLLNRPQGARVKG